MKKNTFLTLFVFTAFSAWSQLTLPTGTLVHITPTTFLSSGIDVVIDGGANLVIASDATDSGSFLVPGASDVTGDITYLRHVPRGGGAMASNWHIISAPVTTEDIGAFVLANDIATSGTNYGLSYYDNGKPKGQRWVYYTTPGGTLPAVSAGNFVAGRGYSSLRNSIGGTYTFKGSMSTVNVPINIPEYNYTDPTNHLWASVGNPYPSFLLGSQNGGGALASMLTDNLALLDASRAALYIWDGTAYIPKNYSSTDFYLAPGQGFLVDPIVYNTVFTFSETLQTYQPAAAGSGVLLRSNSNSFLEIILNLSNGSDTKSTSLKYLNNTTTGLDVGYDAGAYNNTPVFGINSHLISNSEGINFTLQCLPENDYETSVVPLSVNTTANQTLTFSADIANLPTGLRVYLEDRVANTVTDITTASHQLTTTTALNGIGRFYLHTTESALSVDDLAGLGSTLNMYKTSNTNLRVTGLQQEGVALVNMYTTTGKQVLSNSFTIQTVNDIALPNNLAKGIYLVNVVTSTTKQTKKIIIE
jgi:hypothetical protein